MFSMNSFLLKQRFFLCNVLFLSHCSRILWKKSWAYFSLHFLAEATGIRLLVKKARAQKSQDSQKYELLQLLLEKE